MSDTTGNTTRHDADTMAGHDIVSPTEAAARLGITPDAVRARLRRGTLKGERIDRDWYVYLLRDVGETPPADDQHDTRHDTNTTPDTMRHDGDTTGQAATIAAKDETIARLDAEVTFLRRQLEEVTANHEDAERRHAEELERRDVLLREALERIPRQPLALPPESRVSASAAPHDEEPAPRTQEPTSAVRAPWWRRLLGQG